jgi:protein Tex
MLPSIAQRIATKLDVQVKQVDAAIGLLDSGSTVPFIARYRKEVTGGLDDTQLRTLQEDMVYLRELEERREAILKLIDEQGKLTPELAKSIKLAETKTRLEDLYLPYKQKRRTRGQIAIEAGLEPLADLLFANPDLVPEKEATAFINDDEQYKKVFSDVNGVLDGARAILMERFAEDAQLAGELRDFMKEDGVLISSLVDGKDEEGAKYRDYFDNRDTFKNVPSHRVLAMLRGRNEGILQLNLDVDHDPQSKHPCESRIAKRFGIEHRDRPADDWLAKVVNWTWKVKLHMRLETELLTELRQRADLDAIQVFARNLQDLLLAAPAGQLATIGLDPGLRTGVKVAVIDATGQFVDQATIYPHAPKNQWDQSIATIVKLAQKYHVKLLAIGNGTASRETDKLCADLIKLHPELKLQKIMVSEAGASVYSASDLAAREFPDLDVTIRGAVSIARRLQDPLAELVKIDPKSIGVGQYQHDVSQYQLSKKLDEVVEDCVNKVGVEVNTASPALLRRVAGLSTSIAENIVDYRNKNGAFSNREQLKQVPRLGDKTFEQAAGFLRVHHGENPLDASAVHPESYPVVQRISITSNGDLSSLIGNEEKLRKIKAEDYIDDQFGLPTIMDILEELKKPGRDPRPEFRAATFKEGVEKLSDLEPGMILEGTVTNVTNFGAFVDVGVHQDGLVHISALAEKFVKDPHDIVKAGQIVSVKVIEVDEKRKRIALSMRLADKSESAGLADKDNKPSMKRPGRSKKTSKSANSKAPQSNNAFAAAFAAAKK